MIIGNSFSSLLLIFVLAVLIELFCLRLTGRNPIIETITATDADLADADRYARRRLCEDQGFAFTESPDKTSYRCDFTADSCLRNSTYPPVKKSEAPDGIGRPYYEWNTDMKACISGLSEFRKKCDELGMRYDAGTGRCHVTKNYCNCKALQWKDEDCWKDPFTTLLGYLAGDTLSTALTAPFTPAIYQCKK